MYVCILHIRIMNIQVLYNTSNVQYTKITVVVFITQISKQRFTATVLHSMVSNVLNYSTVQ